MIVKATVRHYEADDPKAQPSGFPIQRPRRHSVSRPRTFAVTGERFGDAVRVILAMYPLGTRYIVMEDRLRFIHFAVLQRQPRRRHLRISEWRVST